MSRIHIAVATVLAGIVFIVEGVVQLTSEFSGTHNSLDSTAEYVVTAGLPIAFALSVPVWRHIGRLAGSPRATVAVIAPQIVIGAMCIVSISRGADPSFFNAVAPVCLLTWLVGSVVLARALRRNGALPNAVAIALPLVVPVTFLLSPVGGPVVTGVFWIAFAARMVGARAGAGRSVPQVA